MAGNPESVSDAEENDRDSILKSLIRKFGRAGTKVILDSNNRRGSTTESDDAGSIVD